MFLVERIALVNERIATAAQQAGWEPSEITLVAATKVRTPDTIRQAITTDVTICGENRVQEMTVYLDDDAYAGAALHFIGHLQTNKMRQVVGRMKLIGSAGSEHLLKAIETQVAKLEPVQDILSEVNIGREAPKNGISPKELSALAAQAAGSPHVRLQGSVATPPVTVGPDGNRPFFTKIRQLYVDIRSQMGDSKTSSDRPSTGMSGDSGDAVWEGATLVRVDTALLGPRPPIRKG